MLSFWELARKNLSQKFQGYRMLWSVALHAVKEFFAIPPRDASMVGGEHLSWYLRFETLFLKTCDQWLKIQIFKEKQNLIHFVNQHFKKLGYSQKITDIRLK